MSQAIQILIVEDEQIVAMDLSMGLQHDGYQVVGIADHFEEAVELFKQNSVDIVLMDIHIYGEKDGVACATALQQIKEVPLIYLTAFTDAHTIERVKHTRPSAYLTKPYHLANVRVAIDLALHNFAEIKQTQNSQGAKVLPLKTTQTAATAEKNTDTSPLLVMNDFLFIKQGVKFIKFKLLDITYLEADNNYVSIYTATQKFMLRLSLADIVEKLQLPSLVRIHRSYAINMHHIISFDDQSVKLEKIELPIGRNYKDDFFQQFKLK